MDSLANCLYQVLFTNSLLLFLFHAYFTRLPCIRCASPNCTTSSKCSNTSAIRILKKPHYQNRCYTESIHFISFIPGYLWMASMLLLLFYSFEFFPAFSSLSNAATVRLRQQFYIAIKWTTLFSTYYVYNCDVNLKSKTKIQL